MLRTLPLSMLLAWAFSAPVVQGQSENAGKKAAPTPLRIVLVAGETATKDVLGHHDYLAGCSCLATLLGQTPGIKTEMIRDGWPDKEQVLESSAAVVFYTDGGGKQAFLKTPERVARVQSLANAGVGLIWIHQAIDFPAEFETQAKSWLGGVYITGKSGRGHWPSAHVDFPKHPVTHGVTPWKINDGWLNQLQFVDRMTGVVPLVWSGQVYGGSRSGRDADIVGWAYQRPGGGRSFAFSGLDAHSAWSLHGMRQLVVNGILWSAGAEIPSQGAPCEITESQLTAILTQRQPKTVERRDFSKAPSPAALLVKDAKLEVAAGVCFLEGPAVDGVGNVFFSDIAGNRLLKMDPQGSVTPFRADSGRTNGNTFDAEGRLISCEGAENGPGGRRRIVRTDLVTGQVEVLTEKFAGKRYNSPNDVVVDPRGRIWFTDPLYAPDRSNMEHSHEAVYRIDPNGMVTRVMTQPAIGRPNGLAVTPDGKTLYLIDSNYIRPDGNRKIWAFHIAADGSLGEQRLVYDFGRGRGGDGMRLDAQGNLWVAAGILQPRTANETADVPTGVYVLSPQGELLGRIPIPEDVITNLAFGGPNRATLYVTAGKTLFKISTAVAGYSLYPPGAAAK